MSKFNATLKSKPNTVNLAGGEAYEKSPKLQIASLLLTNFCKDSFYETESQFIERLTQLYAGLSLEDKIFLAKAAIFARNEFGMRSITHVAANIILDDLKWNRLPWASRFFSHVVARPDDMSEILACYLKDGKRKIPNSLKKGFAKAFDKFDDYQIAKYKMEDKMVSLVDIVNLCHPKPTVRNEDSLHKLVANTLKSASTFNNELAKAGREAKTAEEKAENKAKVWESFVAKGEKVEMFALLRNLRNIANDASEETLNKALELLVNEKRIHKSKIMPFRFMTAYDEIENSSLSISKKERIISALDDALDLAVSNIPSFEGRTLVALDCSGSMFNTWYSYDYSKFDSTTRFFKAAVFGAALAKAANSKLCLFSMRANYVKGYSKKDSVISIVNRLRHEELGGGTSFGSIFDLITANNDQYDRIIILSDEQSWVGSTKQAISNYRRKFNSDVKLFMFDLAGHSTLQTPEKSSYCLAGFSDKTFDLMQKLELDPQVMIKTIESIDF